MSMTATERQRRWMSAGVVGGCGVVIAFAVARYGLPLALLIAASGLLVLVIWLLWTSVLSLSGETELTLEEALGLAAPRAEEEQKRAVLRALKDLEYERGVGKVSEEDYVALLARYREEAKALLLEVDRSLDAGREAAEQRVASHLRASRTQVPVGKKAGKRQAKRRAGFEQAARTTGGSSRTSGPSRRCGHCGHRNGLELTVCAGCNRAMAAPGLALCRTCPAVYDESLPECPTCGVRREGR